MYSHERIDPRRGPGRERDDGRREIADGVTEYEEDREAERFDDYGSREDWGADQMDGPWNNPMDDAPAFDDDAGLRVRVEDNRIVVEVPIPANMSAGRWAKIVADLMRRIVVKRTGDHRIRSAQPTPEAL